MRVIIFIGHHKVGSSALQYQLAKTAPESLQNGMLYPVITRSDLDRLNRHVKKCDATQAVSRNVGEAHNALAFSMISDHNNAPIPNFHKKLPPTSEMFDVIREQIATYQPAVLVLAAEVFANFAALTPDLIKQLYAGLGLKKSDEVEIFAYLRRVDDYLASWHGQRIRFGHKIRPLPGKAIAQYQRGIHFDYRLMTEDWLTVRPGTCAILRPYDNGVRKQGSAMNFATTVGLQLPVLSEQPEILNKSIHRGLLDFARQANAVLSPKQAWCLFSSLLKVGPQLTIAKSSQIELFGTRARQNLTDGFAPIHDWLSEQTGSMFFADFEAINQRLPVDEAYANVDALEEIKRGHMHEFTGAGRKFITNICVNRNFPAI